jgi:hypothetical protein
LNHRSNSWRTLWSLSSEYHSATKPVNYPLKVKVDFNPTKKNSKTIVIKKTCPRCIIDLRTMERCIPNGMVLCILYSSIVPYWNSTKRSYFVDESYRLDLETQCSIAP